MQEEWIPLPGKASLLKLFYLPSEKSSTLKKIICFQGGECLIFRDDSLPKGGWVCRKANRKSHTDSFHCKIGGKYVSDEVFKVN